MSDSTDPDVQKLLAGMIKFHGQAIEAIKTGPVDAERARAELATLHQAAGTLASILLGGGADPQHQHERRLELTKIRATHLYEESRESDRAVIQFAMTGLRSVLVANGGALIAMLTFIGNFRAFPTAKEALWVAFGSFVAGLFFSLLAVVFSYFAQSAVSAQQNASAEKIFFHEYRDQSKLAEEQSTDEAKYARSGTWLRIVAIVAAFCSALAFALGSGSAIAALMSASGSAG
jgi:hypothetical protein